MTSLRISDASGLPRFCAACASSRTPSCLERPTPLRMPDSATFADGSTAVPPAAPRLQPRSRQSSRGVAPYNRTTRCMSADLDPEADPFGGGPTLLESDEEADIRDARPSPRRACSYSQLRPRKICSHVSSSISTHLPWLQCVEEQRVAMECTRHALLSFDARHRTSVEQANNSHCYFHKRTIPTGASAGTSGTWGRSTPGAAPLPQRRLAAARNTTPSPWAQTGKAWPACLYVAFGSAARPFPVQSAADPVADTSGA